MAAALLLCSATAAHAQGQCSVAASASPSFGSGTSFAVQATSRDAAALAVASCTGGLLNALVILGTPPYLRATVGASTNGSKLKNAAGDAIPYSIYADSGHQFPITPGVTFNYYQQTVLNALGLLGGTSGNLPMYFSTATGGTLSAGTYTDSFTINWEWHICNIGVLVCLGYAQGTGATTVTLTLTVTNACQVSSAPSVAFGSAPTADSFPEVVQSIGVICTKGLASYTVGLSAGQHASGGRRRMISGGSFLEYDIFKAATLTLWGSAGAERASNTSTSNGVTPELFPYRARIYASQATPPVGVYGDSIVIDVVF